MTITLPFMGLATHEWQAMTFYKRQAAAWEGCIAAPMVAVLSLLDAGRTRALKQDNRKSSVVFIRANMFFGSA